MCTNLGDIMLFKISQGEKDIFFKLSLVFKIQKKKAEFIEAASMKVLVRKCRRTGNRAFAQPSKVVMSEIKSWCSVSHQDDYS